MDSKTTDLTKFTPDARALLQQAAETQNQTVEKMTAMIGRMAELIFILDARVNSIESTMNQRVSVSSGQARTIADAVKARAMLLCEKNDLSYSEVGRQFREAIWRAFRAEYQVPSHYDLPSMYYDNALLFIGGWTSYAVIRRMREKLRHDQ